MSSPYPSIPVAVDPATIDRAVERDLQKAHVDLMRHRETCLFAGVILRGKNIIDYSGNIKTALTNGRDKYYGYAFFKGLTIQEKRGVVMHENLHDALLHLHRDRDLRERNARLYNVAADYVINGMIKRMPRDFIDLPAKCFHDEKFNGWSARQVFLFLEQQQGGGGGGGEPGDGDGGGGDGAPQDSFDDHDYSAADVMSNDEVTKEAQEVRDALQQGSLVAGMRNANLPREIADLLVPKVDWREVLRDFVSDVCKGRDDLTMRRYNRRCLADDDYRPTMEAETIGEIVFAVDTSGSISPSDLTQVASELSALCAEMRPASVRVLWWDTTVHGSQVFLPEQYDSIAALLKPQGGGGTDVQCVSDYMVREALAPEALIVLTDGDFYRAPQWEVTCPTLWVLAGAYVKKDFVPPGNGKVVQVEQ